MNKGQKNAESQPRFGSDRFVSSCSERNWFSRMLEPELALAITTEMCYFNLLSPGECNNSFESSARTSRLVENFLSNVNLQWIPDPSWQQIRYMKAQYHYFQSSFHMFAKFRREPLVQLLVVINNNDKFCIHIMVLVKYFYWTNGSKVGGRDIQCFSSMSETLEEGVFFAIRLSIQHKEVGQRESQHGLESHVFTGKLKIVLLEGNTTLCYLLFQFLQNVKGKMFCFISPMKNKQESPSNLQVSIGWKNPGL